MPLLDHFHAPIYPVHGWESFHTRWAVALADAFNRLLPPRYLAEVQIHIGRNLEADVAEFDLSPSVYAEETNGSQGGLAVQLQTWAPPRAAQTMDLVFPDDIEVQVFDMGESKQLLAVIELISPRNKDRAEARRAFAAKCVTYLQRGIGLLIVDIVTLRSGNLHYETLALLGRAEDSQLAADTPLYAASYRPAHRDGKNQLDWWPTELDVGQPLPLLPLALRGAFFVPVDLEATYTEARQRCRL